MNESATTHQQGKTQEGVRFGRWGRDFGSGPSRHHSIKKEFDMMYQVTYRRDGREVSHTVTKAQALALADYLRRTFRITADIQSLVKMGANR